MPAAARGLRDRRGPWQIKIEKPGYRSADKRLDIAPAGPPTPRSL